MQNWVWVETETAFKNILFWEINSLGNIFVSYSIGQDGDVVAGKQVGVAQLLSSMKVDWPSHEAPHSIIWPSIKGSL